MDRSMAWAQHRRGHSMGSASMREKDEDLALFKDMGKRDKPPFLRPEDQLLDHASLSTDARGLSNPQYSAPPLERKGIGAELLNSDADKTDYDWLMTPPGTPLFPSMDADSPALQHGTLINRSLAAIKTSRQGAPASRAKSPAPNVSRGNPSPSRRSSTPQNGARPQIPAKQPNNRPATPTRSATPTSRASPQPRPSTPTRQPSRPVTPLGARPATPTRTTNSSSNRPSTPTLRRSTSSPNGTSQIRNPSPTRSTASTGTSVAAAARGLSPARTGRPQLENDKRSGSFTSRGASPARGVSPAPSARGRSPSPSLRAPYPVDASDDIPPNLRTSSDRPSSAQRRAVAYGAGPGEGRRTASPARSVTSSMTRTVERPSRGASSDSESSFDTCSQSGVSTHGLLTPERSGRLFGRGAVDYGRSNSLQHKSRSPQLGPSASKKSFESAAREYHRGQVAAFRPLMTNSSISTFYSSRASGLLRRPLTPSSTASSSEHGATVAHDSDEDVGSSQWKPLSKASGAHSPLHLFENSLRDHAGMTMDASCSIVDDNDELSSFFNRTPEALQVDAIDFKSPRKNTVLESPEFASELNWLNSRNNGNELDKEYPVPKQDSKQGSSGLEKIRDKLRHLKESNDDAESASRVQQAQSVTDSLRAATALYIDSDPILQGTACELCGLYQKREVGGSEVVSEHWRGCHCSSNLISSQAHEGNSGRPSLSPLVQVHEGSSGRPSQSPPYQAPEGSSGRPSVSPTFLAHEGSSGRPSLSPTFQAPEESSGRPSLSPPFQAHEGSSGGPSLSSSFEAHEGGSGRPSLSPSFQAHEGGRPSLSSSFQAHEGGSGRPSLSPSFQAHEGGRPSISSSFQAYEGGSGRPSLSSSFQAQEGGSGRPSLSSSFQAHEGGSGRPSLSPSFQAHEGGSGRPSLSPSFQAHEGGSGRPSLSSSSQAHEGSNGRPATSQLYQGHEGSSSRPFLADGASSSSAANVETDSKPANMVYAKERDIWYIYRHSSDYEVPVAGFAETKLEINPPQVLAKEVHMRVSAQQESETSPSNVVLGKSENGEMKKFSMEVPPYVQPEYATSDTTQSGKEFDAGKKELEVETTILSMSPAEQNLKQVPYEPKRATDIRGKESTQAMSSESPQSSQVLAQLSSPITHLGKVASQDSEAEKKPENLVQDTSQVECGFHTADAQASPLNRSRNLEENSLIIPEMPSRSIEEEGSVATKSHWIEDTASVIPQVKKIIWQEEDLQPQSVSGTRPGAGTDEHERTCRESDEVELEERINRKVEEKSHLDADHPRASLETQHHGALTHGPNGVKPKSSHTDDSGPLFFEPLDVVGAKYLLTGEVRIDSALYASAHISGDALVINVQSSDDGRVLSLDNPARLISEPDDVNSSYAVYEYSHWAEVGENLSFSAHYKGEEDTSSPQIIFYPREHHVHVTTEEKKPRIPEFHGMYIKKSVPLALDGVQITVVAQQDSEAEGTKTENIAESDVNGVHAKGPRHTNTTHSSQAGFQPSTERKPEFLLNVVSVANAPESVVQVGNLKSHDSESAEETCNAGLSSEETTSSTAGHIDYVFECSTREPQSKELPVSTTPASLKAAAAAAKTNGKTPPRSPSFMRSSYTKSAEPSELPRKSKVAVEAPVKEEIVESADSPSPGTTRKHMSSFKFSHKKSSSPSSELQRSNTSKKTITPNKVPKPAPSPSPQLNKGRSVRAPSPTRKPPPPPPPATELTNGEEPSIHSRFSNITVRSGSDTENFDWGPSSLEETSSRCGSSSSTNPTSMAILNDDDQSSVSMNPYNCQPRDDDNTVQDENSSSTASSSNRMSTTKNAVVVLQHPNNNNNYAPKQNLDKLSEKLEQLETFGARVLLRNPQQEFLRSPPDHQAPPQLTSCNSKRRSHVTSNTSTTVRLDQCRSAKQMNKCRCIIL